MDLMYSSLDRDEMEVRAIEKIGYAKGLYEAQVTHVKKEEYIRDLLLEDYVNKIKEHRSRYDYIDIFGKAQKEVGNKLKKDRPHLETLKTFVMDDFLNKDKKFKLTALISCGYEDYAWRFEFEGYSEKIFIEIPRVARITSENVHHANDGMFTFGIYESEHCYKVLKRSYVIENISEFIKEYFEEKKANAITVANRAMAHNA